MIGDLDLTLLRAALVHAHRAGWVARHPRTRRNGQWSWASHRWPRHACPPVGATKVVWDGRTLTVQRVSSEPFGWATVLCGQPGSVAGVAWVLVGVGVLPEAVIR